MPAGDRWSSNTLAAVALIMRADGSEHEAADPRTLATLLWPGSFLWYSMAACTLFLHTVSVLAPWLTDEFGLSRMQLGAVSTVIFSCAAVTSLLTGHLVDRQGPRRAMWALFGLNGAAFLALGFAPTVAWVFAGAVLGGIGTALGNPATNQVISTSVDRATRGLVVGVKQAGVPSSAFLAGALMPPIALQFGWRAAVMAGFAFTVVGAVASVRMPDAPQPLSEAADPTHGWASYRGPVVSLTIFVFLVGSGISAVQTYIVLFGVEDIGLSETSAGWGAALVGVLGIVSRVVAAPLAQRFARPRVPLLVIGVGSLISTVLLAFSPAIPALFFVGAAGIGLTALAGNSVAHLAIVTQFPKAIAGKASGSVQTGFYAGFILFPLAFGGIVDLTESYWIGWSLVAAWFCAAIVLVLVGWRDVQPDEPEPGS